LETDTEIVSRLKNRDQTAYLELINLYGDRVVNICFGFLKSEEDARDIAQEVFVEVFLSIRHFRAEASLSTWIYRIAVNKSLDVIRKHNRKKRFAFMQSLSEWKSSENCDMLFNPETPLSRLLAKEQYAILDQAISTLSGSQRIAWTLHKSEGMPQAEAALVMDTTVSAFESLIHRARENICRYVEKRYKTRT